MKLRWRTFSAWLAAFLGLSSCEKVNNDFGSGTLMYGVPSADFDVNIKITDEKGNAIPGIEVTPANLLQGPTYSNNKGEVKFSFKSISATMNLEDVDGEANGGEFESVTVQQKDLKVRQKAKGSGWYSGRFELTGTVKMTRKNSTE